MASESARQRISDARGEASSRRAALVAEVRALKSEDEAQSLLTQYDADESGSIDLAELAEVVAWPGSTRRSRSSRLAR